MSVKRLQAKVAQSRLTLPLTTIYAALAWAAMVSLALTGWWEAGLTLATAILLMTLNNRDALIPFYTRSVSCTFLLLSTMFAATAMSFTGALAGLGFAAFYLIIFDAYQDRSAPGTVYFAFAVLGIVSLFFIQVLYFLPVLWIVMRVLLINLSPRTFFASLLGVITPYWFLAGYVIYMRQWDQHLGHFLQLGEFTPPFDFATLHVWQWVNVGVLVLLGVISVFYFLYTSYLDKIRTRLFYECFTILFMATMLFLVLQVRFYPELMAIATVTVSPLIGRCFALSHSRLSNVFFITITLLCMGYTVFLLWMHSMNS